MLVHLGRAVRPNDDLERRLHLAGKRLAKAAHGHVVRLGRDAVVRIEHASMIERQHGECVVGRGFHDCGVERDDIAHVVLGGDMPVELDAAGRVADLVGGRVGLGACVGWEALRNGGRQRGAQVDGRAQRPDRAGAARAARRQRKHQTPQRRRSGAPGKTIPIQRSVRHGNLLLLVVTREVGCRQDMPTRAYVHR